MNPAEVLNKYLAATGQPTFIFFGPHANCTSELCPPAWSAYGYRPDLVANLALLAAFTAALLAHIVIGVRWRQWSFMACMICGCLDEMLGYGARVWMYYDLWNFNAFMIQVGAFVLCSICPKCDITWRRLLLYLGEHIPNHPVGC